MVAIAVADRPSVAAPAAPYRGIHPFRYADHPIFFAREEESALLLSLVAVYRGVFLYGDSGNGKSSLVNAGLVPRALSLGFDPVRVRVQPRPGEELVVERIARSDDGDGDDDDALPLILADDDPSVTRVVLSIEEFEARLRAASERHRPLIVFDQFEEILTLFDGGAAASRLALAEMIVRLLGDELPVKLLFAFREDYLGRVRQLLGARPELVDHALRLGPPSASALDAIIRGPFERFPGRYERELGPQLASKLRAALDERFGSGDVSLSEVQTVCLRLWQSSDPDALLAEKGVQGLLEDELGQTLDGLPPDLRAAAIALLSQMVTDAGTRNVISAEDLRLRVREDDDSIAPALLDEALERLERDSKLVRRERRRDLYLYEITSEFLVPWISRRRDELRRVQERRQDRRRLLVVTLVGIAVLLLVALAIWAIAQRRDARERAAQTTAFGLALSGSSLLDTQPDLALALMLEAFDAHPSAETRSAALSALTAARPDGLIAVFHGQAGSYNKIAISPDGRTLATADGGIRFWDVATRKPLGPARGDHKDNAYDVAFSPDGRTLASAGGRTVLLWDVKTRRRRGPPLAAGSLSGAPEIAFSSDRRTLAVADAGTIRLYDVRTYRRLSPALRNSSKQTSGLAFHPDGRILVSVGPHTIRLWDVRTHRPLGERLRVQAAPTVPGVAFSPDGRSFATAGASAVRFWSVRTRRRLPLRLVGEQNPDSSSDAIAISPSGRLLAWASSRAVRLIDLRTRRQVGPTLPASFGLVTSIAFSGDGRTLVSAGNDGRIRLWDVRAVVRLGETLGRRRQIYDYRAAFSADGRRLATVGRSVIELWDVRTRKLLRSMRPPGADGAGHVTLSRDGRTLAAAGYDAIVVFDLRGGPRRPTRFRRAFGEPDVALSPDGAVVAAGSGASIALWNARTGKRLGRVLTAGRANVRRTAFSPDGRTLASGSEDGTVRLWDVDDRKQLGGTLRGHSAPVAVLRFSPGGALLASGASDKTVRLWDVEARKLQGKPIVAQRRNDYVETLAFSPDGRTLASAGDDFAINLWDVATHRRLGDELPVSGNFLAMQFTADGRSLAAYDDGILAVRPLLWRDPDELRTEVCNIIGSGLTPQEWAQYAPGIRYRRSCP